MLIKRRRDLILTDIYKCLLPVLIENELEGKIFNYILRYCNTLKHVTF